MSLTAILFTVIYATGLILTFRHPYYGILTYIFEWHNHPPYFYWGDEVPDFVGGRWSFAIALATLISFFLNRHKLEAQHKPEYTPAIWIALIVANMALVSGFFAIIPEFSWEKTDEIFKILIAFLLMIALVRTYDNYQLMIWTMILWVARFGLIAFQEGSNRDIGVIAPNATEENALSAHVMAVLPFFGVYFLRAKKWYGKVFIVLAVPFCLNLIILANSRATLVGLMVIGLASIFLFRGRVRVAAIVGILAIGVLFVQLTNEDFAERQSTETYDDGSASSRFYIWSGGLEMWKDHKMGVGGGGFADLSMDYIPEINQPKTQHNTFVAVFTDWGFIGIILYFCFLAHIFYVTFKIKRNARKYPVLEKYHLEATAIQLAMLGLMGAGLFHSRQYAEVVYWLGAFAMMLNNIQKTELYNLLQGEADGPAEAPHLAPEIPEDMTIIQRPSTP